MPSLTTNAAEALNVISQLDDMEQYAIFKALEPIAKVLEEEIKNNFLESSMDNQDIELFDGAQIILKRKAAYTSFRVNVSRLQKELPDVAEAYKDAVNYKETVTLRYEPSNNEE